MNKVVFLLILVVIATCGCDKSWTRVVHNIRPPAQDPTILAKVQQLEKRIKTLEEVYARSRTANLRKRFEERVVNDRKTYPQNELREIESLYQDKSKPWGSIERCENLKVLVKKYPKANRAGCAILYLGQMAEGQEREKYFRQAIDEYGDCWYGDGVQVGAYARLYLARYYKVIGNTVEEDKLYDEIRQKYPDAVSHRGDLLTDIIPDNNEIIQVSEVNYE